MSREALGRITARMRVLRTAPPGDRFHELHRQRADRRTRATTFCSVAAGLLLVLTGFITYPIPGPPSTLMVLAGLALVAQEWEWLAHVLDRAELRLRARRRRAAMRWRRLHPGTRAVVVLSCLVLLAAGGYALFRLLVAG